MNRHKYRAWDEANKKMVEVISLKFVRETNPEIIIVNGHLQIAKPEFLMPFIDILDSDKKEIYLGDILLVDDDYEKTYHQVIWVGGDSGYPAYELVPGFDYMELVAGFDYMDCNSFAYLVHGHEGVYKVVGNIFQNRELLEQSNEQKTL